VSGLISGISSMMGRLGGYLGQVGDFIRNNKGPIEKDRKLLVPAGRAIMQGLITGIADEKGALGAELGAVTGMFDSVGAGLSASPLSGLQPPALEAYWKPGSTGDPILDGLRGAIGIRFNGDPYAALGSR
jgi:phage-related protein